MYFLVVCYLDADLGLGFTVEGLVVVCYLDADLGPDRGKGVSRLLLQHLRGSLVAEVVVLLHELLRGHLGLLGADLLPHVDLGGGLGQDLLWRCEGETERARAHTQEGRSAADSIVAL